MDKIPLIDLHIHSKYSDGTFTPEEIVKEAKRRNIEMIALTDHNTLAGIPDFRKACKKYNQKALAGIEISTSYKNKEVHLLGYFPLNDDLRNKKYSLLKKILKEYKGLKQKQNEAILQKIIDVGRYDISIPDFYKYVKSISVDDNYNRVHIAKYMVYKGLVDSIDDAFDYIGEGCDFYVEKETVTLGKAIKAIRAAGGISVIAHLGEYDFSSDEMTMFFNYCRNNSVHGFECFHPSHTKIDLDNIVDNTLYMIDNSSTKYNFLLTAGSDFHGKNKKNILGETCICKLDERLIRVMNLSYLKTFKILEERLCI